MRLVLTPPVRKVFAVTVSTTAEFQESFPQVVEVFESGRQKGLHHGLQLWVAVGGKVLLEGTLGESRPGQPLTSDDWLPWLSACKPLTAIALAQLKEQGRLNWDDPVVRFLPEFASHGKEQVTLRHILTHTAGMTNATGSWPGLTWEESLDRIANSPLDAGAIPGQTAAYHFVGTWFVLGEIVQRLSGVSYGQAIWDRVLAPCGVAHAAVSLGMERAEALGDRLAPMWERDRLELRLADWHLPPRLTRPSPGSSWRGPIRELGRVYEMLRRDGQGPQQPVLSPESVRELTARHRVGEFDATLGHIVDFGLGFLIDSNQYGAATVPYGYGPFASPRTFGHGGSQCSQGYCDPEHDLVVAYVFNGRPGEAQHNRRCRQINEAIYRDLNVVPSTAS